MFNKRHTSTCIFTFFFNNKGLTFSLFRSATSCFRDTRLSKIGNAPKDPRMTLTTSVSKVPCVHWILAHEAQISLRFALRPANFEIQACQKRKCTQWPHDYLNHLRVKSTPCTLNTHPRGPNFNPFRSTTSHFRDTGLSKIGMHRMTQNNLNHLSVKNYTIYTEYSLPRPKFHCFALRSLVFQIIDFFGFLIWYNLEI